MKTGIHRAQINPSQDSFTSSNSPLKESLLKLHQKIRLEMLCEQNQTSPPNPTALKSIFTFYFSLRKNLCSFLGEHLHARMQQLELENEPQIWVLWFYRAVRLCFMKIMKRSCHCSALILDLGRVKEFGVHTTAKVINKGQKNLTYSRKFCFASFLRVENRMDHVRVWIFRLIKCFILLMSDFFLLVWEDKILPPQ